MSRSGLYSWTYSKMLFCPPVFVSKSHFVTLGGGLMSLYIIFVNAIAYHLISANQKSNKESAQKSVQETSFLWSYWKIWCWLISCWKNLMPWDCYMAMIFTLTEQEIHQKWNILDLNSLTASKACWKSSNIPYLCFMAKYILVTLNILFHLSWTV